MRGNPSARSRDMTKNGAVISAHRDRRAASRGMFRIGNNRNHPRSRGHRRFVFIRECECIARVGDNACRGGGDRADLGHIRARRYLRNAAATRGALGETSHSRVRESRGIRARGFTTVSEDRHGVIMQMDFINHHPAVNRNCSLSFGASRTLATRARLLSARRKSRTSCEIRRLRRFTADNGSCFRCR